MPFQFASPWATERIHMQSPKLVVATDYRLNEGVTFCRLGLQVKNNCTTKRSAPRDFIHRKKLPGIRDGIQGPARSIIANTA